MGSSTSSNAARYANYDENSNAEGAVGYDHAHFSLEDVANNYEQLPEHDPLFIGSLQHDNLNENIYETIDEVHQAPLPSAQAMDRQPIYNPMSDVAGCSTYGHIGNAYGRIDILGHGIGRIERHLSSSCGSIDSNHYAIWGFQPPKDSTGRISKVSIQWLLANKWLPLWVANTDSGRDYHVIDFMMSQQNENNPIESESNDEENISSEKQFHLNGHSPSPPKSQ